MATFVGRLRLGPALAACRRPPFSSTLPKGPAGQQWLTEPAMVALPTSSSSLLSRFCHQLSQDQAEREIYSGILSTQIKLVKTFSLGTSIIGTS